MPPHRYVPCLECGDSIPREEFDEHTCDKERWVDYQIVRMRPDIARFEADFHEWTKTNKGMFEVYYAEHSRHSLPIAHEG